jgi:hypothetical protein
MAENFQLTIALSVVIYLVNSCWSSRYVSPLDGTYKVDCNIEFLCVLYELLDYVRFGF